jgi:lysozyme family protein
MNGFNGRHSVSTFPNQRLRSSHADLPFLGRKAALGGIFFRAQMTDLLALKAANEKRWADARFARDFYGVAKRLVASAAKSRYQAVSASTRVPWPVIAVIHERECSQDWTRSLAQGDPWKGVSVHVPAGRGPFSSWEEAAVDALTHCAPYAARNTDWSIGGTLTKLEEYNGLGYAARHQPSPYIWSGTDQYKSGKYVRDGVYDPNAVDNQLGCAGLLLSMMELDPAIGFDKPSGPQSPAKNPSSALSPKSAQPSIANPSKGSIGAFVTSILAAIFKRK